MCVGYTLATVTPSGSMQTTDLKPVACRCVNRYRTRNHTVVVLNSVHWPFPVLVSIATPGAAAPTQHVCIAEKCSGPLSLCHHHSFEAGHTPSQVTRCNMHNGAAMHTRSGACYAPLCRGGRFAHTHKLARTGSPLLLCPYVHSEEVMAPAGPSGNGC